MKILGVSNLNFNFNRFFLKNDTAKKQKEVNRCYPFSEESSNAIKNQMTNISFKSNLKSEEGLFVQKRDKVLLKVLHAPCDNDSRFSFIKRFFGDQIHQIIDSADSIEKLDLVEKMLSATYSNKYVSGRIVFTFEDIMKVLKLQKAPEETNKTNELLDFVLSDNFIPEVEKRVHDSELSPLIRQIFSSSFNKDCLRELLMQQMSKEECLQILERLTTQTIKPLCINPEHYLSLWNLKYDSQNHEKCQQQIAESIIIEYLASILKASIYLDSDIVNSMADNEGDTFQIFLNQFDELTYQNCEIFRDLTDEKKELVKKMLHSVYLDGYEQNVSVFSLEDIIEVLKLQNTPEETQNATELVNFIMSDDFISEVDKAVNNSELSPIIEQICPKIFHSTCLKQLLLQKISKEEFLVIFKKFFNKTVKLAYKYPERYLSDWTIEECLKPKESYQKDMLDFIIKHLTSLLKAYCYLDSDTINQMMDKRTEEFNTYLSQIDSLTIESCSLLKQLIKCSSKDRQNKMLTAKEKIELCQLVNCFQKNGLDKAVLNQQLQNGQVSLNEIKKNLERAIFRQMGVSDVTLNDNFPSQYMLNKDYAYLLLLDDDITTPLRDVVINIYSNNFGNFILDESNQYGKANKNTEEEFLKNGLNYNRWLKPHTENIKFCLKGKPMTIKMWERNPKEDLFIGNKTSCCTAITTGSNDFAVPIYLLNTSFNVVELYDEKGEVIGMSRIFMAKANGKPALIMDNIELNGRYRADKIGKENILKIRNNFFKYMNSFAKEVTGDDDSTVYFSNRYFRVPVDDLKLNEVKLNFIGDISHRQVYINFADRNSVNFKKLKSSDTIDFLVVPSENEDILD